MVLERSGPLKGTGTWKMPTGHTDPGEDLMDAVVREVKEETGEWREGRCNSSDLGRPSRSRRRGGPLPGIGTIDARLALYIRC